MEHILLLYSKISEFENKFVDNNFKSIISQTVRNFFPKLNNDDINILDKLTIFIVDLISYKYGFKKDKKYYEQWTQNNNMDIKGVILLLLPFIDDKDNGYILRNIHDLNQLLCYKNKDIKREDIYNIPRNEAMNEWFKYGNMAIGLLDNNGLEITPNNDKLIYHIIIENFNSLLDTLEIINGKMYINWINITPLNLSNYKNSSIYKRTERKINEIKDNLDISNTKYNYGGLWLGDFYNIMRIKFYEDAKKIKWLFFPYEYYVNGKINRIYILNGLNRIFNLDSILKNEIYDNDKFILLFDILINKLKMGESYFDFNKIEEEVCKYALIYFINNSPLRNNTTNNIYDKFKLKPVDIEQKDDDFTREELNIINNITIDDIINTFELIRNKHLKTFWDFLKDSIDKLKSSSYGKIMIKDNMISNEYYYKKETKLI